MNDIADCFTATREVIARAWQSTILSLIPCSLVSSRSHELDANLKVHRMLQLCSALFSIASKAPFAAIIGAAIWLPRG